MTPLNKQLYKFNKRQVETHTANTLFDFKHAVVSVDSLPTGLYSVVISIAENEGYTDLGSFSEEKAFFLVHMAHQLFDGIGRKGTIEQMISFTQYDVVVKFGMVLAVVYYSVFGGASSPTPKGDDYEKKGYFFPRFGWQGSSFLIGRTGNEWEILDAKPFDTMPLLEQTLVVSQTDEIGVASFLNLIHTIDLRR